MDTPVLWHIPFSHYSEKARWALDYKGIAHRRRVLGSNYLIRVWRATGQGKLPVLWLDGRAIADSTRIIAALEEHYPEPPLYPREAAARQRALALEDDLDETLGPALRAAVVTPLFRHDPDTALRMLTTGMGSKAYRMLRPLCGFFQGSTGSATRSARANRKTAPPCGGARPDRAGAAGPRVSCRRCVHGRRPHGRGAAVAAPAATPDLVPAAAGTAAVPARLPRQAVTASSHAMGGRHIIACIADIRGSCQAQMTLSL